MMPSETWVALATAIAAFTAFAAGAIGWSLTEYSLHRWAGHPRSGSRGPMTKEHLDHHRNPDYFTPWWRKLMLALPVTLVVGPVAVALLGLPAGLSLLAGYVGAWLGYEWLHRRIHTVAPRNRYGDWARRHHLAHHFTSPQTNHGVTSPLWDQVFGTFREAPSVRIPAKRLPIWLQPALAARARFVDAYTVVGRPALGDPEASAD